MQCRIHQLLHGISDVFGGKWSSIRKEDSTAQLECNLTVVFRYFPRLREFRFESLKLPIHADEHAAGKITDCHGSVVFHFERIEGFRLKPQAKSQLSLRRSAAPK